MICLRADTPILCNISVGRPVHLLPFTQKVCTHSSYPHLLFWLKFIIILSYSIGTCNHKRCTYARWLSLVLWLSARREIKVLEWKSVLRRLDLCKLLVFLLRLPSCTLESSVWNGKGDLVVSSWTSSYCMLLWSLVIKEVDLPVGFAG